MVSLGDTNASVKEAMGDVSLPTLADPSLDIADAYRIDAIPTAVFITSTGRIADSLIGATTAAELAERLKAVD